MNPSEQAKVLYHAGRLREAGGLLSTILRSNPSDASAMQLLGVIQFQSGFQREGTKLVERATKIDPTNAEAWNSLGLIRHLGGNNDGALDAFDHAVESDLPDAWKNRGFVLLAEGRPDEALESLSHAGNSTEVRFFLGNTYAALGRHAEALVEFEDVLATTPEHVDALHNRGNSMLALGLVDQAISSIKEALKSSGREPLSHCNLALALHHAGRNDEALGIVNQVLEWDPKFSVALEILAVIARSLDDLDSAANRLSQVVEMEPTLIEPRAGLARTLQGQGKWRLALDSVKSAAEPGLLFLHALLMPVVFESSEMIDEALDHLTTNVAKLREAGLHLDDPLRQVGVTTFHLPYFGVSERPYQEQIANLYLESTPSLKFHASHAPGKGRIRLGILSGLLTEHTIAYVYGGLFQRLDKERFEVVFLQIGPSDAVSERLASTVEKHVRIAPGLAAARDQIAREKLDILFYPEIGMDVEAYFLAFSRLAPVQCTIWGHPLTTGSPVIDHYISSLHLEREDGQAEYTEKLALMPHLTTYFKRPLSPTAWGREEFGMPENRRIYACPQMAYKFHPDYDRVLNEILERDDKSTLALVEPLRPYLKQMLLERWTQSYPKIVDRVIWLAHMPHERFLRLLQLADCVLAPIQFGAGRSSLEAFGVGVPVVTFKGNSLKSRITYAAYKEIGFEGIIAETEEEYVELAVRLANDRKWRSHVNQNLSSRSYALFENRTALDEFQDFLVSVRP